MTTVTTALPTTGTRMSLDAWLDLPFDDEFRSELVEGVLVVTSAPVYRHQVVVMNLLLTLHAACPPGLRVLPGPLGVLIRDLDSGVMPDLVVLAEGDQASRTLDRVPRLVVEVASPSTRGRDRREKRRLYAHRGIPSYWLVDPRVPDVRVLELGTAGDYVEVGCAADTEDLTVTRPFPLTVRPADLLA